MISEQEEDAALRELYASIYAAVGEGRPLSSAMEDAGAFPVYMVRMLQVAERTGTMEQVLRELARYYDRQEKIRRTVRTTVAYPLLLLVVVLAVFFVFLTQVLPVFDRVFDQIGATMQPAAALFLRFGLWLSGAKWCFLGIFCGIAVIGLILYIIPGLRKSVSGAFSRAFAHTKTGRRVAEARLASVLALTFSGTADITEALALAGEFTADGPDARAVEACAAYVLEGVGFSEAVARTGLFAPVYCRMLAIGERTGATEAIMHDVARRTEEDMDIAIDRLTGKVEPAAVIVLSLFVGLLLLSVMLPLVGIMSAL